MLSILYVVFFLYTLDAFPNPFTRSESTQLKERCGQSILLNNHFWLLKQTHQALEAIRKKQMNFEILPWERLSISISQIYQACLIDDLKSSQQRMYLHQTAIKAGTFLAKKAQDLPPSTLIKIQ